MLMLLSLLKTYLKDNSFCLHCLAVLQREFISHNMISFVVFKDQINAILEEVAKAARPSQRYSETPHIEAQAKRLVYLGIMRNVILSGPSHQQFSAWSGIIFDIQIMT